MTDDTIYEGDDINVGDHVWIIEGVHPEGRTLRGVVTQITPNEQWGTPDFLVEFSWPTTGKKDEWTLDGTQIERINIVDRLGEIGAEDQA